MNEKQKILIWVTIILAAIYFGSWLGGNKPWVSIVQQTIYVLLLVLAIVWEIIRRKKS